MPDTSKEEGVRDRTILELLFSTGLRVFRACEIKSRANQYRTTRIWRRG